MLQIPVDMTLADLTGMVADLDDTIMQACSDNYCEAKSGEIEQGRLMQEIVRVNEPLLTLEEEIKFVELVDEAEAHEFTHDFMEAFSCLRLLDPAGWEAWWDSFPDWTLKERFPTLKEHVEKLKAQAQNG